MILTILENMIQFTDKKIGMSFGPYRILIGFDEFNRRFSSEPDFLRSIAVASNEAASSLVVGDVAEIDSCLGRTVVVYCEPSTTGAIVKLAGPECSGSAEWDAFVVWLYPDFMLSDISAAEIDYSSIVLYKFGSQFYSGKYIIVDLNTPKPGYEWISEDVYEKGALIEAAHGFSAVERYSVKCDGEEVAYCYRLA